MSNRLCVLLAITLLAGCEQEDKFRGTVGPAGATGATGNNGHNAVVSVLAAEPQQCANGGSVIMMATDSNDSGTLDSDDANIQTAIICSGQDTVLPDFTPVDVVQPCGPQSAPYKEVLLILANGDVLASFSDNISGYNTRFTFVPDGNYMTTDGSDCQFSLSTSGSTRTASWPSGSKSWQVY